MSVFFKRNKELCLLIVAVCLGACTPAVTPVEQIHQTQQINKDVSQVVVKQVENASQITVYRCKNDKKVEVERKKRTKKSAQKESVTVNFQGTSYKLSSVLTKDGKKYTNIRWTWHETRNGTAFLYNNTKQTLATNCIK